MREPVATFIWEVPIRVERLVDDGTFVADSPYLNHGMDAHPQLTVRDAVIELLLGNVARTHPGSGLFLDESRYTGSLPADEVADLLLAVGAVTSAPESPIESHLPTLE